MTDGFYYDFDLPEAVHGRRPREIDRRMRQIVKRNQRVRARGGLPRGSDRAARDQPFKVEIIEGIGAGDDDGDEQAAAGDTVSLYANDALGRPVPGAARAVTPACSARSSSRTSPGAYWRGDEHNPQLTRIYGTAWATAGRPRRRTCTGSRRPSAATTAGWASSSTCSRSPTRSARGSRSSIRAAASIRRLMEDYSRRRHEEAGYEFVNTPHITKSELFETSGHLEWYADGMFPPMELDGGTEYYLKPMNCPMHILIYRSRTRSYRELPLRLFEFGTVYRYEKSGVVHGLTRVRGLTHGRRAHLHDEAADGRGAEVAAHVRARPVA